MNLYQYQIGGSLTTDAPSYIERKADKKLYAALKRGEFCYVLNSRQMGKSSLMVKTRYRLQQEGFKCVTLDMTNIGSENITPTQWYKGVVAELCSSFKLLKKFNLKLWWKEQEDVSLIQKLSWFIEKVLLVQFSTERLFIFIDEIDSILSLDFPVDDFFALIRYCYNQRANNPEYNRITFAIFGVATPSDLIQDKNRTPFNIGKAIELEGFQPEEAKTLAEGLAVIPGNTQTLLKEVLAWSGGQPFLTQKLCQLIVETIQNAKTTGISIFPGTEAFWVETVVRERIIHKWESQDEPEHLKTIRDRVLRSSQHIERMLGIYQQILQGVAVPTDDSREQIELILSGLVVKKQGFLQVKNRIYQEVFNLEWLEKQLSALRPYSQNFNAWIALNQKDESRLLRGQALRDAQVWSLGKSLSDLDYQFLAASQEFDRREVEMRLNAERLKEVEGRLKEEQKRLAQERKTAKVQWLLLLTVTIAFFKSLGLGFAIFLYYQKAVSSEQQARISEIQALVKTSETLRKSNQRLDALIAAIGVNQQLQNLDEVNTGIKPQVEEALQQVTHEVGKFNRIFEKGKLIMGVDFSPKGNIIATADADKTVKLWTTDGRLLKTLEAHDTTVYKVKFSSQGDTFASICILGTIKLWRTSDGKLLRTLQNHGNSVWQVAFSPSGDILASVNSDGTIKLWRTSDGTLLKTLKGHDAAVYGVAFSPIGDILASSSGDGMIKLWKISDGTLLKTLPGHNAPVWDVKFNSQGILASGSADNTVKLWTLDGKLLKTLNGHTATVFAVSFNSDGNILTSASGDRTIKLWKSDGKLLKTVE